MLSTQIKNTYTSIGEPDVSIPPSSLFLKLTVSSHSIKYFIQSLTHGQIIFYGHYTLHHVENEEDLAARIEKIFWDDQSLQLSFGKVVIGIDSNYALVPLGFRLPVNTEGVTISHKVGNSDMEILFNINYILNYKLKTLFPDCNILHLSSSFIGKLPEYLNKSPEKLFVNVNHGYLDIIRFSDDKRLQLMNRYEYKAPSDFLYFVLLCCDELKINREETELVLMGGVDIQSKIYSTCYHYFPNISFIQQPEHIRFSKAFDHFPKHLDFNLYNLSA